MTELSPEVLEVMRTEIAFSIRTNVNGKIDGMRSELSEHNLKHERDMERMMPIIEAFEEGQRDLKTAQKAGKSALWVAGAITAIGGAYLVLRAIFTGN